jgi:hypothetical protein
MLLKVRSDFAVLERKLYRLVIARLDGDRICDASYSDHILELTLKGIGGFMLTGGERDEVKSLLAKAQSLAEEPLFIASSVERGLGERVKDATLFPGPMAFAAALGVNGSRNLPLIKRGLAAMAAEAADFGITMPLIPAFQPDGGSEEGEDIAPSPSGHIMERLALEYAEAFRDKGLSLWWEHISPSSDPCYRPALPRSCAGDGPGIVARTVATEDNPAACIASGADLLVGPDDPDAVVSELIRDLTGERVDAILERIDRARPRSASEGSPVMLPVDYQGNEELSREIAQRAVTLVKGRGKFLPVRDSDNLPLIYSGDVEYFITSPLRFFVKQASHESKPLPTHERPVVFLLFGNGENGKGPINAEAGRERATERLIRGMSPSIAVSFGSPHLLSGFKGADILIAAYDSSAAAQEAAFNCIIGERHFEGGLPVEVAILTKKGPVRP